MNTVANKNPFEQAIEQFHASLAPKERSLFSKCNSADELLSTVEDLEIIKKSRESSRLVRRVKLFNDSLGHYFAVIDILVQSHPEYAALAWGAVRLVLQLASNFHEFFEKLTRTLERLSEVLPWYEDLARSLKGEKKGSLWPYQASARLKSSLTAIYVDILTFFQSVVRVFTKKDTSNRSRPIVLTSLFWKPFDARFKDTLEAMRYHRELLKAELSLYGHQTTRELLAKEHADLNQELRGLKSTSKKQFDRSEEIRARLEELIAMTENTTRNCATLEGSLRQMDLDAVGRTEQLAEEINERMRLEQRVHMKNRIRSWLSAPEFARELERARECRETGTSGWFFEEKAFQKWSHYYQEVEARTDVKIFGANTIWVQGNPGFGKTIIAGAVVDKLETLTDGKSPVFYYFFRQEPIFEDEIAAYRSIITQILHHCHDDEILDRVAFAMQFSPTAQPIGTKNEIFELIQLCTGIIGPHFIVLDGIDECSGNESLIRNLLRLGPNSRTILFSRPNVRVLPEKMPLDQRISIGKSNSPDIRTFLQRRLEELADRNMLLEGASIFDYTDHLAEGADGMFLWARLMIDYLDSDVFSDQDRHETIMAVTMPEKLSGMYLRICRLICQGYEANRRMARWIILWITFAKRPLTASELEESIRLLKTSTQAKSGRMDFERAVVMTCAGLVEKAPLYIGSREHVLCFRFIHSTVEEYFRNLFSEDGMLEISQEAMKDIKSIVTPTPHMEISRSCLQYILYCMPAQSLSEALGRQMGTEVTILDLEVGFPLSGYATVFWIRHLQETSKEIFSTSGGRRECSESVLALLDMIAKFLRHNQAVRAWIEAIYVFRVETGKIMQALKSWNDQLRNDLGKFLSNRHDIDVVAISQDVEELIRYVPILEKYWGFALTVCPGRIWAWDEIDGFIPSQFSDRSSTTVHSLYAGNPSQAGETLSSQYLCKVSESTPDFIGTLSIWTSREFEKHQGAKPQRTMRQGKLAFAQLLSDKCVTGWIARYEVWSIGQSPKRLFFHDILLKDTEVRLQLLQSLRINDYSSNWKVQFPVTVSPNLRRFAVLRTVYWLTQGKGKNEGQIRHNTLDLDFNSSSKVAWDQHSYDLNLTNRVGKVALYTYWIRFGTDGNRIFFIDQRNTAVYLLHEAEHEEASLLSFYGGQDYGYRDSDPLRTIEAHFHPHKPVVAYRTGRRIFIWAFRDSRSQPILFYETPSSQLSYPEQMSFSSSSDQLIVKEYNSELALVLPLPAKILCALEDDNDSGEEGLSMERDQTLIQHPNLGLWCFKSASRSLVSGAHVETLSSGESLGFTPLSSSRDIGILLWRNTTSGFEQERLEIFKLPAWEGVETVKTSMKFPEPGESDITVVLNKAVQPENTLRPAVPEHFPVVVRREVGSLRRLLRDNDGSKGKRLDDGGARKRKREEIANDDDHTIVSTDSDRNWMEEDPSL